MIVCIQPLSMWSGTVEPENAVYLDVPLDEYELDDIVKECNYGENYELLVKCLVEEHGGEIVTNPIYTINV